MARYYTAEEAVRRLGVSRNTLYAYVSRGLIRSEPDSREKRTRRYHAQDVERLASRSEVHKSPENALRKATDWGAPLLDSAITLIGEEGFYYRGQSVLHLAEQGNFEETVAVLWESAGNLKGVVDDYGRNLIEETLRHTPANQLPVETFLAVLASLDRRDVKAFGFTPATTAQAGATMRDGFMKSLRASGRMTGLLNALPGIGRLPESTEG